MVPRGGLEPPSRFATGDFKSPVFTSFTTEARQPLWQVAKNKGPVNATLAGPVFHLEARSGVEPDWTDLQSVA